MKFASDEETAAAMVVTARWLPELVRRMETGVLAIGVSIEKKAICRHADGTVDPVLLLRGRRGWQLELHLRNALEDFLTLDRDESPVRVDLRLFDREFAEKRLGEVVGARLAMVRTINESRRAGDVAKKIKRDGWKHGQVRVVEYEGGIGGRERC